MCGMETKVKGRTMATVTKFELNIECDNSAFEENTGNEVARILRDLANQIEQCYSGQMPESYPVRDINGNRVGLARFYQGRS
jgi:hypothetical protein